MHQQQRLHNIPPPKLQDKQHQFIKQLLGGEGGGAWLTNNYMKS